MPRTARASVGGICYHVISRGNARAEVFHKERDYEAFIALIAVARVPLAACPPVPFAITGTIRIRIHGLAGTGSDLAIEGDRRGSVKRLATNRVAVDVLDHSPHHFVRCDIAVMAAAFLPESSMHAFPAARELSGGSDEAT